MLESVLEKLLLQYLENYVQGISRDKLHFGVLRGALELNDLTIKRDSLAGIAPDYRVRYGRIGCIKLTVPWRELATCKWEASVKGLELEIESIAADLTEDNIAKLKEEVMDAKRKAIEVRTNQLADLLQQADETGEGAAEQPKRQRVGRGRQILNNITVTLSDVSISFINERRNFACNMGFPDLKLLSTDHTFGKPQVGQQCEHDEVANSMFKLIQLTDLFLKVSPANSAELDRTEYILCPLSARCEMSHVPNDLKGRKSSFKVRLEVATEELAELLLRRSQVKHIRKFRAQMARERQQLYEQIVPPDEEKLIFSAPLESRDEYSELYRKQLVSSAQGEMLSPQEELRMQLLENAFSTRVLAVSRLKVQNELKALQAIQGEQVRRHKMQQAETTQPSFWDRLRWGASTEDSGDNGDYISETEREELAEELAKLQEQIDSKVVEVDLPQCYTFEFVLGKMAVDLVDDRETDEVKRQLFSLALKDAFMTVDVGNAVDRHGKDSVEWTWSLGMGAFHAFHKTQSLFNMAPPTEDRWRAHVGQMQPLDDSTDDTRPFHEKPVAAKLAIKNELRETMNLLSLTFRFEPVQIHMLPGIAEYVLEFWRNPDAPPAPSQPEQVDEQASAPKEQPSLVQDVEDMSKLYVDGHRDKVKQYVQGVIARAPDRLQLSIKISSPIVHVPVSNLGYSSLSLGELVVDTQPCAYKEIDMKWVLNNTAVRVTSNRGEHFDMIQPVPIELDVNFRGTEDKNQVTVQVDIGELVLSASPQALQILTATPGAMMSIMYPPTTTGSTDTGSSESAGNSAAASATHANASPDRQEADTPIQTINSALRRTLSYGDGTSKDGETGQTLGERAAGLVQEVLPDEMRGSGHESLIQVAQGQVENVKKKQFQLNLLVAWKALHVTLSDSVMPVMKLRMEFGQSSPAAANATASDSENAGATTCKSGLVMYQQSKIVDPDDGRIIPYTMKLNMLSCALELDLLHPETGCWEPVAERFNLALEVERKEVYENVRATHVIISGHQPLLLNFKPAMLRLATQTIPLFVSSLTSKDLVRSSQRQGPPDETHKYRVINLCQEAIQLKFESRHHKNLTTTIHPTGSKEEPLDEWVLQHFVTHISVALPGKEKYSEQLSLERVGAVTVPDSHYVAELLTPSSSHRLLLLATSVRVHNRTDLPLEVRFFHGGFKEDLIPTTSVCDAALVGKSLPKYPSQPHLAEPLADAVADIGASGCLELAPNAICSMPAAARTSLSIRPSRLNVDFCDICDPMKVNSKGKRELQVLHCQPPLPSPHDGRVVPASGEDLYFVCELEESQHVLPNPLVTRTVNIQPSLCFLNALPVGQLQVRYGKPARSKVRMWHEAVVPRFSRVSVYNFQGLLQDGVAIQARLTPDIDWEPRNPGLTIKESDPSQTLSLCQHRKGAAAAVNVEPLGKKEVRFSSPNWFIDRSGLFEPEVLEMHYRGKPLPREGGITLLPADVLEKPCELVLRDEAQPKSRWPTQTVRLPPSWIVFPWRNVPNGPLVFCIQSDEMASSDVLGAQCEVMTLRPRLVVTNASDCNVEVKFAGHEEFQLPAGESKEHHWHVKQGEEDHPVVNCEFRPNPSDQSFSCKWSGTVVCSDADAGSTPFVFVNDAWAVSGPEVWSVEIAPVRGALAVVFRRGSDFVAQNNCKSNPAHMSIKPFGCEEALRVPRGEQKPFGWTNPFGGQRRRSVDVFLNGRRIPIGDVRRTQSSEANVRCITGHVQHIVVSVKRVGNQTVLSVDDAEEGRTGGSGSRASQTGEAEVDTGTTSTSAGSTTLLQCDIRLSRLGISIIEELPTPQELLFVQFELIRFAFEKNDSDVRSFRLAISEAQIDCQLPGRVDANTAESFRARSMALLGHERPAVILANCAAGDRAFLSFFMQRGASGSRDILLHRAEIELDALDITIDDHWLDPVVKWVDQARSVDGVERGKTLQEIQEMCNKSILNDYVAPELPNVVQVDQMKVGGVNFAVWCALKLKAVGFLPQYVRTAMQVMSFSGQFTLDGANLILPSRQFPPHRGSLKDFLRSLGNDYVLNLISSSAAMLGKSSLLNLPRVPLKFGGSVVSYLTESLGLAAGEAASLMGKLTFDDDYIARQRAIREQKRISGFSDGVVEAGKSLAHGIEGFADIVRKPVEGHQEAGCAGLVSGLGKGLAGTCVKPIENLGQAISDVGSGIAAQVGPESIASKRRSARVRQRLPRLLHTQLGEIRPWCELEAEVLQQLGIDIRNAVDEVVPLVERGSRRWVMLLFSTYLLIVGLRKSEAPGVSEARRVRNRTATMAADGVATDEEASPQDDEEDDEAAKGAGETEDLFDALEGFAEKLVMQAWKPWNNLMHGVQDMEAQLFGESLEADYSVDPTTRADARKLEFKALADVRLSKEGSLQLIDKKGRGHGVNLGSTSRDIREALAQGFRAALSSPVGRADWSRLRNAIFEERRTQQLDRKKLRSGAGERVLEVFEIQRKWLPTGEWVVPFGPFDREFSWRWVDASGTRHPHLLPTLSREQCASATIPPCAISSLFSPKGRWNIERSSKTDAEGWMYSLAWNSSTWETKPGLFDAIRKRRWTRKYV